MIAMLKYFAFFIGLVVFSTRVSAYVPVCLKMLSEVALFWLVLFRIALMGVSAVCVLEHDFDDLAGTHKGLHHL